MKELEISLSGLYEMEVGKYFVAGGGKNPLGFLPLKVYSNDSALDKTYVQVYLDEDTVKQIVLTLQQRLDQE